MIGIKKGSHEPIEENVDHIVRTPARRIASNVTTLALSHAVLNEL